MAEMGQLLAAEVPMPLGMGSFLSVVQSCLPEIDAVTRDHPPSLVSLAPAQNVAEARNHGGEFSGCQHASF